MKRTILFVLLAAVLIGPGLRAQRVYSPTEENLKARAEFRDNKFGIFPS